MAVDVLEIVENDPGVSMRRISLLSVNIKMAMPILLAMFAG